MAARARVAAGLILWLSAAARASAPGPDGQPTAPPESECRAARAAFERPAVRADMDALVRAVERDQSTKTWDCDYVVHNHTLYRRGSCATSYGTRYSEMHLHTANLLAMLWYSKPGTVPDAIFRVKYKACNPVKERHKDLSWCAVPSGAAQPKAQRHGRAVDRLAPLPDAVAVPAYHEAPCTLDINRLYSFTLLSALLKPAGAAGTAGGPALLTPAGAAGTAGGPALLKPAGTVGGGGGGGGGASGGGAPGGAHADGPSEELARVRPPPPWSSRKGALVWRGASTGRRVSYASASEEYPRMNARLRIALLSARHPAEVDAALVLTKRNMPSAEVRDALIAASGGRIGVPLVDPNDKANKTSAHFLSDRGQAGFKYIIDLDGDGCSGRFSKMFTYGSVVLKTWTHGVPYLNDVLQPWEHFVPIKQDLSDLLDAVRWLQRNDDAAREIARRGAALVLREASPRCVAQSWRELAAQYASRATRPVRLLRGDKRVPTPPPGRGTPAAPLLFRADFHDQKRRSVHVICHAPTAAAWAEATGGVHAAIAG